METPRKISWILEEFKIFQIIHSINPYKSTNYLELKYYLNELYGDELTMHELRSIRLFLNEVGLNLSPTRLDIRIDRLVYLGFENDTDILDKLET